MTVHPLPEQSVVTTKGSVVSGLRLAITSAVGGLLVLVVVRLGVVAVPLVAAAVVVLVAAFIDEITRRIPNPLIMFGFAIVAAGIPIVAASESSALGVVAARAGLGVLLGGAPILFLFWLLDPRPIGGGDWKLLGVSSAALGLVVPIVAVLAALLACAFQFLRFAVLRERVAPFGPAIAAGFLVALAATPLAVRLAGGGL